MAFLCISSKQTLTKARFCAMHEDPQIFAIHVKGPADLVPVEVFVEDHAQQFTVLSWQLFQRLPNFFTAFLRNHSGFDTNLIIGRIEWIVRFKRFLMRIPAVHFKQQVVADRVNERSQALR